jgi:hypothetical protein
MVTPQGRATFVRTRRVRQRIYIEALTRYHDETGKPRRRCVARWPAGRTLADEIDEMQRDLDLAQRNVMFWQGLIDRTVHPLFPAQISRAPRSLCYWRRRLATATTRLAQLSEARAGLEAGGFL